MEYPKNTQKNADVCACTNERLQVKKHPLEVGRLLINVFGEQIETIWSLSLYVELMYSVSTIVTKMPKPDK